MHFTDYQQAIARIVHEIDPKQDAPDIVDMRHELDKQYAPRRFNSMLINAFTALALVLAMIGLYGIVAYGVAARSHEIGIRMALGAERSNVVRLVLRRGLFLTAVGVVIGVATSYALAQTLSSLLFEVQVHDTITFMFAPLLLMGIAAIACTAPARRAARISPMIAIRNE
jgi:putative ABC transport system permease protein